jgi:hypothetical protein
LPGDKGLGGAISFSRGDRLPPLTDANSFSPIVVFSPPIVVSTPPRLMRISPPFVCESALNVASVLGRI